MIRQGCLLTAEGAQRTISGSSSSPSCPEGSSGTLKSGQIMTNNYGELRNYGLVHDNYGRMDNFGTTLHNHEDGEVYVYSGSVLENEGYLIYPVFFNDGPYSVDVENNPFVFHEETRWTRLDLDYKFILTPDAGYSIVGFKDLPDYVETSESNGTWTLRLPADRPQGRIGIAPDMIARTMGDNPGGAEATLQISRHMQKNQGILNNYGTLDLNQGTVVNYQGALIKTNEGDVYNMGGRVENNSGTVYSPFSVHTEYGMAADSRTGEETAGWHRARPRRSKSTRLSVIPFTVLTCPII